ncbi:MAG: hypothetical protein P3A28_05820 [Gemmatimonadota bacterium]|nr:hypothetical protein [Gemmatimonadota bacterium]
MTGGHPAPEDRWNLAVRIAATAWLILFLELALIRFLSAYVRVFAFYTNFVIIAAFLGMGTGMLRRAAVERLRWAFPVLFVVVVGVATWLSTVVIDVRPDHLEWLWGATRAEEGEAHVPLAPAVIVLFALSTALFVPLGALLGAAMAQGRALSAYAADLFGSLCGVLAFASMSAWGFGPMAWFSAAALVWLGLSWPTRRLFAFSAPAVAAVLALTAWLGDQHDERWSPYYRITLRPALEHVRSTQLDVNGAIHQVMLDFNAMTESSRMDSVRKAYERPYRLISVPDTVLVVGAGTGNDLAILLALGVKHIDAVEIDRDIASIGRDMHPMRPYDDPRVHVSITDARAFLRSPPHRYDLIVFGTLDSHTLLGGASSVRLDNYVYTTESFRAAHDALRPGGSVVLYHMSGLWFVAARLYQNLAAAFDMPPRVLYEEAYHFNYTFVAGAGAVGAPQLATDSPLGMQLKLSTDNWPFPYLRGRRLPAHYTIVLAAVLVLGLAFVAAGAGRAALRHPNWPLFLVGAGFLLLETKGITTLSLLFGSTWTVNAAVIAAILGVALLATILTARGHAPPTHVGIVVLALSLMASMIVRPADLASTITGMRWVVAALYVGIPVLFASFIFSKSYAAERDPTGALAFNILGAVAGGVLEYSSMSFGIDVLNWLALCAYGLAARMMLRATRVPATR